MTGRRWTLLLMMLLLTVTTTKTAAAQPELATNRASDTGYAGLVNSSGGFGASVPLDLPAARGDLPVPVQIVYGERRVGAAGLGWDVPLSYIHRDNTVVRRRPVAASGGAPQAREEVSLVLGGRRMDLVRTATAWLARSDAPDIEVRERSDGTWIVYDGHGRAYVFAAMSSALAGTGVWLLRDVTGPGGTGVHLEYTVATPTVSGSPSLTIDLASVSYNPHPTTANCYKHSIILTYDSLASSPLSLSLFSTSVLARLHKLTTVDVTSKESCGATPIRLRRYELSYFPDADTRLPRLKDVTVKGREGTPEASTPISIASYAYGAATNGGTLKYQVMPSGTIVKLGHTRRDPPPPQAVTFPRSLTDDTLLDVTGDGRPDRVTFDGEQMSVARNRSSVDSVDFLHAESLSNGALSSRALEARETSKFGSPTTDMVWREMIDVNGDGRIDLIDAKETPGRWSIYLNTPNPQDPSKVVWVPRSYSITAMVQALKDRGYTVDSNHLPLGRRLSFPEESVSTCWVFNGFEWSEDPDAAQRGACEVYTGPLYAKTVTEWEIKDVNGDSYPDLVFNSSRIAVTLQTLVDERETQSSGHASLIQIRTLAPKAGNANKLQAMLNVLGVHIANDTQPFSTPVTLRNNEACGIEQSLGSGEVRNLQCSILDVNGDGIVDRVNGASIMLGTGSLAAGTFFTAGSMLTLPGWLETQQSNISVGCADIPPPGMLPTGSSLTDRTTGLRDLTGDGVPDYIAFSGNTWRVLVGTGTGFAPEIPITGTTFALSSMVADCAGFGSTTIAGLLDVNGDGRTDVVSGGRAFSLVGSDGILGAPSAGRLVRTSNGFGADTTISYRSAKADGGLHQVPFGEIIVDAVAVNGAKALGGTLAATRYAYGGAELIYSPALDAFRFPGYRRRIVVQTPVGQPAGIGTATITDAYAHVSATDPYGLDDGASPSTASRYMQYHRLGRTRDVTVLSGPLGDAVTAPRLLLDVDIDTDPRRIAGTQYNWGTRQLSSPPALPGSELCTEMVFPYDEARSKEFSDNNEHYDGCSSRGFTFALNVQSWRSNPGGAPPSSDANVEVRSEVQAIDDFGRILRVAQHNDLHRSDDDLCVDAQFATPTGSNERVLFAASSRTVSNCGGVIHAKDSFEYDTLPAGSVSSGFLTSHTVERRDDAGALLGAVRTFDATIDALGNPIYVSTTREDRATRATAAEFDSFGLTVKSITTTATGVPTTQVSITRDEATLLPTLTTDANGTQHGATFDGFDRPVLSTITPPGGVPGALSITTYQGFTGSDAGGRRVTLKVFTDPVAPNTAPTASGRTTTTYLDELGRLRFSEIALGEDYQDQRLYVGGRTYDGLGRVVFEADPYPSTQGFATAYGTTRFFAADGTLSCSVRGPGRQSAAPASTNEAQEIYPTCFQRAFQNHTEVLSTREADSFLVGSPQFAVTKSGYTTAIGRLLSRSTFKGGARLEHADFSYDRLGHMTGMTRYQEANAGANPVTTAWHYDSLGQILELREPDSAPQSYTYSDWGELIRTQRTVPTTGTIVNTVNTYDALRRVIHTEQRNGSDIVAETVSDYFYDQGTSVAPHVTPTNMLGRLALATSPTGSEAFSYDAFGRVNARVFSDNHDRMYIEKHSFHGDGSIDKLDIFLPDTAYTPETVEYTYDSAGHGALATYKSTGGSQNLFDAMTVDVFGRVREAKYGVTTYTASYADGGRQLLEQVMISSTSGSRAIKYQSYDPLARERSRLEVKNGESTGTTTTWQYDPLGRLSSSVRTRGDTTLFNQQLTYDALGNILTLSDVATSSLTNLTYLSTDRDRICRIGYTGDNSTACNVTYDEVGSIIKQTTPTGQRQYSYLANGSVQTITDLNGSAAHYRYDAFGKVQELELTSTVSNDTRSERRYGALFHCRKDASSGGGCTMSRNIPGPDGSVASRRGPDGPWVFQFGEQRGNRFFTDQNGTFIQDVDFDPYGKPTSSGAQPGSRSHSSEQWNGGDSLAAFGISQLGARLYDPAIGRFLSRDPLLIPRTATTTNPYAFAFNDPVNLSDPSGLDALCVEIGHSQDCTVIERPGDLNPTGFLTWNVLMDWDIPSLGIPDYQRISTSSGTESLSGNFFPLLGTVDSVDTGLDRANQSMRDYVAVGEGFGEALKEMAIGIIANTENTMNALGCPNSAQACEALFYNAIGQAESLITTGKEAVSTLRTGSRREKLKLGGKLLAIVGIAAVTRAFGGGARGTSGGRALGTRGLSKLHDAALDARDALAADLAKQRHPPATVVGGYSPSTGRVTAGASRGGGLGCAEGVCAETLGHPPDMQFTPAVRPRTGQPVDVCPSCEVTYGRRAFPDPATRFRTDAGGH